MRNVVYWAEHCVQYVERSAGNEFVTLAHIHLFIFIVLKQSLKLDRVAQVIIHCIMYFPMDQLNCIFILILYFDID